MQNIFPPENLPVNIYSRISLCNISSRINLSTYTQMCAIYTGNRLGDRRFRTVVVECRRQIRAFDLRRCRSRRWWMRDSLAYLALKCWRRVSRRSDLSRGCWEPTTLKMRASPALFAREARIIREWILECVYFRVRDASDLDAAAGNLQFNVRLQPTVRLAFSQGTPFLSLLWH